MFHSTKRRKMCHLSCFSAYGLRNAPSSQGHLVCSTPVYVCTVFVQTQIAWRSASCHKATYEGPSEPYVWRVEGLDLWPTSCGGNRREHFGAIRVECVDVREGGSYCSSSLNSAEKIFLRSKHSVFEELYSGAVVLQGCPLERVKKIDLLSTAGSGEIKFTAKT